MKKHLVYMVALFVLPLITNAQNLVISQAPTSVVDGTEYVYMFSLANASSGSMIKYGSLKITSDDLTIYTSTISGQNAHLKVYYSNNNAGSGKNGTLKVNAKYLAGPNLDTEHDLPQITINVTVKAPATKVYYNTEATWHLQKNDCPDWWLPGSFYTYVVPANKWSSTISQADADAKAKQDAQNQANQNTSCLREKEVRTPKGTAMYEWEDYKEDIVWDVSRITGANVKIERVDNNGAQVYSIANNIPNTGRLVNGLNKTLPSTWDAKIRITDLTNNVVYLSDGFYMATD